MSVDNPIVLPENWDSFVAFGMESPGICQITGAARKSGWDVKKSKGAKGAVITYTQDEVAKFSAKLLMWLPEHFEAWDVFRPKLAFDPVKNKQSTSFDIYHPALSDLGIKSVVVEEVSQITPEGDGLFSVTISFIEYLPPPKVNAVKTPAGSSGNSGGKTPGDKPKDAEMTVEDMRDKLIAEAAKIQL